MTIVVFGLVLAAARGGGGFMSCRPVRVDCPQCGTLVVIVLVSGAGLRDYDEAPRTPGGPPPGTPTAAVVGAAGPTGPIAPTPGPAPDPSPDPAVDPSPEPALDPVPDLAVDRFQDPADDDVARDVGRRSRSRSR